MYYPKINFAISNLINNSDISHQDLATMLNLTDTSLRSKRLGRHNFTADELLKLSKILRIPIDYLLSESKPEPASADSTSIKRGRPCCKQNHWQVKEYAR